MSTANGGFLAKMTQALSALKLPNARDAKLSRLDFGILQVAMMIAVLDGQILPAEVDALLSLAKRCRNYSEKAFGSFREQTMRSAGYLLLVAQTQSRDQLLSVFIREAVAALPDGFACGRLNDVRRAFVMWTAMGLSDGTFSAVEREAVEALRRALAEIKRVRSDEDYERSMALSPMFRQAYGSDAGKPTGKVVLVDEAFLAEAEKLLKKLRVAKDDAAEVELQALIEGK